MPKPCAIICTVGISCITNAGQDSKLNKQFRVFQKKSDADLNKIAEYTRDFPGYEIYLQALNRLNNLNLDDSDELNKSSAEVKSLKMIFKRRETTKGDTIHLLCSGTPDGTLTGRILKDFLPNVLDCVTKLHFIKGLQVNSGRNFVREGIKEFIGKVYSLLKNECQTSTYDVIFNHTGGFKSVVPYLTLIGMLEGISTYYIYEFSNDLIHLMPIPISFEESTVKEALPVLAKMEEESGLSDKEIKSILNYDRDLSLHPVFPFLQEQLAEDGEGYLPSGLGFIVWERFKYLQSTPIYLSKKAYQTYHSVDKSTRKQFQHILEKLREPKLRKSHLHSIGNKTDCLCHKPGNTDERAFYFVDEDGSIKVCELCLHSDGSYDDLLNRGVLRQDYIQFEVWNNETL